MPRRTEPPVEERTSRSSGGGPRTRGGWTPAGTAELRRTEGAQRRTGRGEAARRQLLDAARRVFERDGYTGVGIADIVREAGVSQGSFYTYFSSKLEVLRELMDEVVKAMDTALVTRPDDEHLDPMSALERSNQRYMEAYRGHGRLYVIGEQLARIDDEAAESLHRRRRNDVERVAATIRRWQARGVADPTVDPVPTAAALVTLTRHLCYWLYIGGDDFYDEDSALSALNATWIRTVDLRRRPSKRWLRDDA